MATGDPCVSTQDIPTPARRWPVCTRDGHVASGPVDGPDAAGMDAVEALRRSSGVATRAQVLALGVARRSLERAVRDGELVQHRRALSSPGAPPELVSAAHWGGAVGCASALRLHGIPVVNPSPVHLLLRSSRPTEGVTVHRGYRASGVQDLVPAAGRAIRCIPRHEALVVADAVVRLGIDTDLLRDAAGPRPGATARWVLTHADARAESLIESLLRALVLDAGIRCIGLQVPIPGAGRVDLLVDGWLVLEADGFASHGTPAGFQSDRDRDSAAAALGLVTLRFTHRDLVQNPEAVTAAIHAVTARRSRATCRLAAARRYPRTTGRDR